MTAGEISKPPSENEEMGLFNLESHSNLENWLQRTAGFVSRASNDLFYGLIVLIAAEIRSCIHVKK